jgi:rare lipoprotein A
MRAGLRFAALWVAAAATLTGCAEMQFLSQASKEVTTGPSAPPADPAAPDLGTHYKIGNPYQVKGIWYYPRAEEDYVEEGIASWYGPNFHLKPTANGAVFDQYKVSAAHRTLPLPSMVRVTNLENGRSLKVIVNDRGPFAHSRIIDLSRRAAQLLDFEIKGTTLVRVEYLPEESARLAASVTGGPAFAGAGPTVVSANADGPPPPRTAPTAPVDGEDLAPPPGAAAATTEPAPAARPDPQPTERPQFTEREETSETVTVVPVKPNPNVFIQAGAFGEFSNANRARSRLSYLGPIVVEEITRSETPLFRVRLGPLRDDETLESLLVAVIDAGFDDARIVVAQ